MGVQHGSNSVESEPIGLVLLQPEPDIRQQKSKHLVFRVVKNPAVPQRMLSFLSTVKILVISSIPHIDALIDILGSVRVNQIDDDLHSQSMGFID